VTSSFSDSQTFHASLYVSIFLAIQKQSTIIRSFPLLNDFDYFSTKSEFLNSKYTATTRTYKMSDKDVLRETLLGMDFPADRVEIAVNQTKTMDEALNWFEQHDGLSTEELKAKFAPKEGEEEEEESEEAIANSAQSLRCVDCGKLFSSPEKAEFHAIKT
jgi:hypothetical protein